MVSSMLHVLGREAVSVCCHRVGGIESCYGVLLLVSFGLYFTSATAWIGDGHPAATSVISGSLF
jgi:hypothetical protein